MGSDNKVLWNYRYRLIKEVLAPSFKTAYHVQVEGEAKIKGPAVLYYLHPFTIDFMGIGYAVEAPISFMYREHSTTYKGVAIRDLASIMAEFGGGIVIKSGNGDFSAQRVAFKRFYQILDKNGIVAIALQEDSGVKPDLEVESGSLELVLRYVQKRQRAVKLVPVGLEYKPLSEELRTILRRNIPVPFITNAIVRIGMPIYSGANASAKGLTELVASESARLSNREYDSLQVK